MPSTGRRRAWLSAGWHVDAFRDDTFKVLVYLTDVDNATAPFEYALPDAWRRCAKRDQPTPAASRRVLGAAGTTLVFRNSNAAHRANHPARGVRDVLNFHFRSVSDDEFEAVYGRR